MPNSLPPHPADRDDAADEPIAREAEETGQAIDFRTIVEAFAPRLRDHAPDLADDLLGVPLS
jgi:hypothetical protein